MNGKPEEPTFTRFVAKVPGVLDEIIVRTDKLGNPQEQPSGGFQCFTTERMPFQMRKGRFHDCYRRKEAFEEERPVELSDETA